MIVTPLFVSSGDLIADKRYQWAMDLAARGDMGGAADILAQAVEIAPAFAGAWFALATMREAIGDRAGAIAAFEEALARDTEDSHGARLHLARLGMLPTAPAPSAAYMRGLFDQQAPVFDQTLLEGLDYRGPALLRDAVAAVCRAQSCRMRFGTALDLGCGTGLVGAAFRPHVDWLIGVDLSPRMIEQARAKGIYDRLAVADIAGFLDEQAVEKAKFHLVIAADVFVYCPDLAPIIAAVVQVLEPGGLFAFTVETHAGVGVRMGEALRYAHGAGHVRDAVTAADLTRAHFEKATLRTEKGAPVPGLIVVARRPASTATSSPAMSGA